MRRVASRRVATQAREKIRHARGERFIFNRIENTSIEFSPYRPHSASFVPRVCVCARDDVNDPPRRTTSRSGEVGGKRWRREKCQGTWTWIRDVTFSPLRVVRVLRLERRAT